jgi:hypothetical protein
VADVETNTDGGLAVGGNVGTGGGNFTGRDSTKSIGRDAVGRDQTISTTIYESADNVAAMRHQLARIYESADNVAAMRHQLARLEDNSQWRLAMLEQKIDNLNDDFQTFRNSLMAGYVRLPNNEPPNQTMLIVMISVVLILILLLVGLAVYWSIRQPPSSPQSMLSSALPFAFSTILTLFTFF